MQKYFVFFILVCCLTACTKEIDFDYNEIDAVVVVEGRVTNEGTYVSVTKSRSMTDSVKSPCLPGAVVTISLEHHPTRSSSAPATEEASPLPRIPLSEREKTFTRLIAREGSLGVTDLKELTGTASSTTFNTLKKLYNTLKYEWPTIEVDAAIAEKAVKPIDRMLEISKNMKSAMSSK